MEIHEIEVLKKFSDLKEKNPNRSVSIEDLQGKDREIAVQITEKYSGVQIQMMMFWLKNRYSE